MTRRATLRASDRDRDQVAERLRHAAAEGRLQTEELEDRLHAALSAKTYAQLDAVVSDLPAPELARRSRSPAPLELRRLAAVVGALSITLLLIADVAWGLDGSHEHHHWVEGLRGAPVIWLLLLAGAWRLIARRRQAGR